jgi:hypothetical protein
VICLAELIVKAAATPLKVTSVTPVKFTPLIVTKVPAGPLPGVKPLISGGAVKEPELFTVLTGVVTLIGPFTADAGTVAVICVAESTV